MRRLLGCCSACSLWIAEQAYAASALQTAYYHELTQQRTRELLLQALPQWALGVNIIAATTLYFVWRSQRDIPHFNWLLGACLTGNVVNITLLYPDLLPAVLIDSLLCAWMYCLTRILFTHPTFIQQRWFTALAAGLLVALGLAGEFGGIATHTGLLAATFSLLTIISAASLYLNARHKRDPKLSLMLGVFLLGLSGALDNLAVLYNWHLVAQLEQIVPLNPLAQMLAVILALYFLVTHHANNQLQLSQLNATLDSRVRDAEYELEDRYRLLTHDALETAAIRERRNIYQSIHEDLSDKLLQLIYRAPTPETADLARAALAELRDTQKLQPEQQKPLLHILADAFAEVQTRCDQAGKLLSWQVSADLEAFSFNARQESALTRTLREAISNLFKHARASEVSIQFSIQEHSPNTLLYIVSDNGVGIDPARPSGRGLVNIRHRLEELGGQVTISAADNGGTCLQFFLPFVGEKTQWQTA